MSFPKNKSYCLVGKALIWFFAFYESVVIFSPFKIEKTGSIFCLKTSILKFLGKIAGSYFELTFVK